MCTLYFSHYFTNIALFSIALAIFRIDIGKPNISPQEIAQEILRVAGVEPHKSDSSTLHAV